MNKKLCLFFFLVIATLLLSTVVSAESKVVWKNNGHTYQLFFDKCTWKQAKVRCEDMGGHLVTITTSAEQKFVYKQIMKHKGNAFWIGYTDEGHEGNWRWVTGENGKYTNWGKGEPNNGGGSGQHYANMYTTHVTWSSSSVDPGQWDDTTSSATSCYICEWDGPKFIKISGPSLVAKGKTIKLTAEVSPLGASQKVTWKCSNIWYASVSDKGVMTGKRAGTVVITATSAVNKKIQRTWTVKVMANPVEAITITGAKDMDLKDVKKITLTAKATPAKASQEFEWKSSNTDVATVTQKGVVQAVSVGKAKITVTAKDGSGTKASVTIKVDPGFTAEFSNDEITLNVGQKWKVGARVKIIGSTLGWVTVNSPDVEARLTHNFKNDGLTTVQLEKYYTIDTTKAPWNAPGDYRLRIWAKDVNGKGGDMALAEMTIHIISKRKEVVDRANAWYDYTWTTIKDLVLWNGNGIVPAGTKVHGLPYTQNFCTYSIDGQFGEDKNYKTQITGDKRYVQKSKGVKSGPKYGAECVQLVYDCWYYADSAIGKRDVDWTYLVDDNLGDSVKEVTDWTDIKIADCFNKKDHIMLIVGVNDNGTPNNPTDDEYDIIEQTVRGIGTYKNWIGTRKTHFKYSDLKGIYKPYRYISLDN